MGVAAPINIGQRAEVIVEHFRAHAAAKIGGHTKAMVVTSSRLHAVRYYLAIKAYIEKRVTNRGEHAVRALVAFSGTVVGPDVPQLEYREGLMNGFSETMLPERFADDEYQVLVVAEKYQTGFDQPLLHTMCVAKKTRRRQSGANRVRLNRIAPGKEDTFVLDFENGAADIIEAFAPRQTGPRTHRAAVRTDRRPHRAIRHGTRRSRPDLFEQLSAHVGQDKDIKVVALNNDIQQFGVFLEPKLEGMIIDRHEANEDLLKAFFDQPEFRTLVVNWMTQNLYRKDQRRRTAAGVNPSTP